MTPDLLGSKFPIQGWWGQDRALRLIVGGVGSRPCYFFYVTVAIGELPGEEALKGAPVFPEVKEAGEGERKNHKTPQQYVWPNKPAP